MNQKSLKYVYVVDIIYTSTIRDKNKLKYLRFNNFYYHFQQTAILILHTSLNNLLVNVGFTTWKDLRAYL